MASIISYWEMVSNLLWVTEASGTHIKVHRIPKSVLVWLRLPTVRMTLSATFPGNVKHLNYAINSPYSDSVFAKWPKCLSRCYPEETSVLSDWWLFFFHCKIINWNLTLYKSFGNLVTKKLIHSHLQTKTSHSHKMLQGKFGSISISQMTVRFSEKRYIAQNYSATKGWRWDPKVSQFLSLCA